MKKIIQIFKDEYNPSSGWAKWADKVILIDDPGKGDPEIPLVIGTNLTNRKHRQWVKWKRPYFSMGRPYLGGWASKQLKMRRIAVNSYSPTQLKEVPYSRWNLIGIGRHPWKTKEIKKILIAPPKKSIQWWTGQTDKEWADSVISQLQDPSIEIRTRLKPGKRGVRYSTLWQDFDWADLVISYSSASTVEAFWYGKKVISLGVCPTWWCCENVLKNWADAKEPLDRDQWHERVAWTQFTYQEFETGDAQEMTVHYQGWPTEVVTRDNDVCEFNIKA